VSVTAKRGKVIIRFRKHQCTFDPDTASKTGLALINAAKKAAKQAKAFGKS
jgi:hypothetical protein